MTNRSLVLLSGEGTTIPMAEAKALFLAYDEGSTFVSPEPRLVIADSETDPFLVGSRIAFARRAGVLVQDRSELPELLRGFTVRFRAFDLEGGRPPPDPERFLRGIDSRVDLRSPGRELTLVRGREDYLVITDPMGMHQGWSTRRPRRRPFFHPSAIFPKLSRALVNLSRCKAGDLFLDPFAGTGSIPLEASLVGAQVLAVDQTDKMVHGALANMNHFGQNWLGVVRADAASTPVRFADAAATDVPYGRASSTRGREAHDVVDMALGSLASILRRGGVLVLMHPKQLAAESPDFAIIEEHELHVHKRLTRTVSVMRRR